MNLENVFTMDVETGGFSADNDGLCSIAVKVLNKDIKENIFIKINPELNYHPNAMAVNQLNVELLNQIGITEVEAINKVKTFIKTNFSETPEILGQNIPFDIKFVEALFKRNNQGSFKELISENYRDTKDITQRLKKEGRIDVERSSLGIAYKYFTGKEPVDAHDAMGDVLMTEELYLKQLEFMESN